MSRNEYDMRQRYATAKNQAGRAAAYVSQVLQVMRQMVAGLVCFIAIDDAVELVCVPDLSGK